MADDCPAIDCPWVEQGSYKLITSTAVLRRSFACVDQNKNRGRMGGGEEEDVVVVVVSWLPLDKCPASE